MKSSIDPRRKTWNSGFSYSAASGVVLFLLSVAVNYFATMYASERVSLPVTDVILNNIPVLEVGWIIVYGALLLSLFTILVMFNDPRRIPFVLKSMALFIVIRSVFVSLTHLGPFLPEHAIDHIRIFNILGLTTTADLFFSGHTGIPFLLSLIYWDDKKLRWTFLTVCVIFAVSVLFGHLHYSIDVFAAFFITYTIFHIAQKLFAKDWRLATS